jgi:hypothetical protein
METYMTDRERQALVLDFIVNKSEKVRSILLPEELADLRSLLSSLQEQGEPDVHTPVSDVQLELFAEDFRKTIESYGALGNADDYESGYYSGWRAAETFHRIHFGSLPGVEVKEETK